MDEICETNLHPDRPLLCRRGRHIFLTIHADYDTINPS